jgi:hypothetical protein
MSTQHVTEFIFKELGIKWTSAVSLDIEMVETKLKEIYKDTDFYEKDHST